MNDFDAEARVGKVRERAGVREGELRDKYSTMLMALGAVLGISLAAYGLFTAKGTVSHGVPPEDAALVNQRPILMSDFVAQAETTYAVPFAHVDTAQRKTVLSAMIREELYVQRGLELDFPATDPDTRNALVAAVEQQAVADATTELPSEEALQRYYNEHRLQYATEGSITVEDLVLQPEPKRSTPELEAIAVEAVRALRNGTEPTEVIRRTGLRVVLKGQDEEFYFAARIHLGERLFEVAKHLSQGAVSDPQVLADGVHILRMIKNSPPVLRSFSQAREQVLGDYKRTAAARLRSADEKYLYDKADIQIAPALR